MPRELFMAELYRLVGELRQLEGMYADQFYQVGLDKFRIKVSGDRKKKNINISIPYYVAVSDLGEVSEEASNLSLAIRKRMGGARIKYISLYNSDRIVNIEMERKDETLHLILEMFGQGNMILTGDEMKILLVYRPHEFADRTVRHGNTYIPPKNTSVDITDMKAVEEQFAKLEKSDGRIVSYISSRIGIGTMYVEEALMRAGVEPRAKAKDTSNKKLGEIRDRMVDIIKEVTEAKEAFAYRKGDEIVDFSVCRISKYADLECVTYGSVSEAIGAFYPSGAPAALEKSEEMERIKSSIEKQEQWLATSKADADRFRRAGDYVSVNSMEINRIIKLVKENKGIDEKALADETKGIKITKLNRKTRTFTIDMDDGK